MTGAVSAARCQNRVNNTPRKLIPCIRRAELWAHMKAFQAIADANPGADGHPSRNSGEPGYKASVDYVARPDAAGRIQRHRPDLPLRLLLVRRHTDVQRGVADATSFAFGSGLRHHLRLGQRRRQSGDAAGRWHHPAARRSGAELLDRGCTSRYFTGFVADGSR